MTSPAIAKSVISRLAQELGAALLAADTKARAEDIYLPFKPKRRTRAQVAREAGLEPLADRLLADPALVPEAVAVEFVGNEVADAAAALDGARDILVERAAEDAELVGAVREKFWSSGSLRTAPSSEDAAKSPAAQKFRDYFDYSEALEAMPSHRVLAVLRGEKEEALSVRLDGARIVPLLREPLLRRLLRHPQNHADRTPRLAALTRRSHRRAQTISGRVRQIGGLTHLPQQPAVTHPHRRVTRVQLLQPRLGCSRFIMLGSHCASPNP